jgi:hypothetical protein
VAQSELLATTTDMAKARAKRRGGRAARVGERQSQWARACVQRRPGYLGANGTCARALTRLHASLRHANAAQEMFVEPWREMGQARGCARLRVRHTGAARASFHFAFGIRLLWRACACVVLVAVS